MNNIVFFGQADAGKSTLAGYIISKYDRNFRLSRYIDSMRKENSNFDETLAYSAIMNTNRDEQAQYNHLNSRAIHLRKIDLPFDNVTIIDTPGAESYHRQRERGMFYGNVGIFFMEINNILNHQYRIETLAPIALWSRLENKRMIFLLTKFDTVHYDEDMYLRAVDEAQDICTFFGFAGSTTVIPTAIEVDRLEKLPRDELDDIDLGENILTRSEKMPWYDGKSLFEAIKDEINELDEKDAKEPLMFCITDQVERPDSYSGKVWNIKILSGILRIGQEICFAPVKDTNNNFRVLTANVKQLRSDLSRFDDKETIEVARKGEMVGLDIRNCSIDKSHAKKSTYDAISSTCGFSSSSKFLMGETFAFEINKGDVDGFQVGREMKLVWFGRSLAFIIEKMQDDRVYGRLKSTQIAMPLIKETLNEPVLVKGTGEMDFYNCGLVSIGD